MILKITVTLDGNEVYEMQTDLSDDSDIEFCYDENLGEPLSNIFRDASYHIDEDQKQMKSRELY